MEKTAKFCPLRLAALALTAATALVLFVRVEQTLIFFADIVDFLPETDYVSFPLKWPVAVVALVRCLLLAWKKPAADIIGGFLGLASTGFVLLVPTLMEASQLMGGLGSYHFRLMPLGICVAVCCGLSAVLTVILCVKNR